MKRGCSFEIARLLDQSGKLVKLWVGGYNVEGQSIALTVNDVASRIYMFGSWKRKAVT